MLTADDWTQIAIAITRQGLRAEQAEKRVVVLENKVAELEAKVNETRGS